MSPKCYIAPAPSPVNLNQVGASRNTGFFVGYFTDFIRCIVLNISTLRNFYLFEVKKIEHKLILDGQMTKAELYNGR